MIGPGRYVVHYYAAYGRAEWGINPTSFRNRVKALIGYGLLHGNAFLTLNLPFNPFCQTYRQTGFVSDGYGYLLATMFLTVTGSLEESDLKALLARAFGEAGANLTSAQQATMAHATSVCGGKPGSRGQGWYDEGECIHIEHDDGVTYENWQTKAWLVTRSGFEPWQHTEQPDPQTTIPANTINADRAPPPPPPQPRTVTTQPPSMPQSGTGGGEHANPNPDEAKKAELYANIAISVGVLAAAVVLVWAVNRSSGSANALPSRRSRSRR